jgi:hypothetical protein
MRDYGKVFTKFWVSPDIIGLSDDAKLMALYLLTGQHSNALGCFRLPSGYVASDLSWNASERVSKGFGELSAIGFVTVGKGDWLLLPKYLKFNPPENPNVGKMIHKLYSQVPEQSGLIPHVSGMIASFPDKIPESLVTLCKGFAKPFRTVSQTPEPEPEPEPEPNQNQTIKTISEPEKLKNNSQRFLGRFSSEEEKERVKQILRETTEALRAKY